MRKIYLTLSLKLQVTADEGVEISEVIQEMDYNFKSQTDGADIVDSEIIDYEIVDSK
jgi:hypothetical protein